MPLTPSNGDKHAAPLIRLYRVLELALWRILAKLLGLEKGWGRRWLTRMLMRLPNFRKATRRVIDNTAEHAPGMVATAINRAWRDGTTAARGDTGSRTEHHDPDAVRDIIDRVLSGLDTAHRGVLADTENIYRRVIDEVSRDPNITNDAELHNLLREALRRNARFGFVATTDQHGRRRELVAYAEQQIRHGVTTAEVEGFCAQARADGHDLITISDVPGACRLCAPFEGKTLSISGESRSWVTHNNSAGQPVAVWVLCSLTEAMTRGLYHPNCRHTAKVWTADDPAPPPAIRAPEPQRVARRTATAANRKTRSANRMAAASMPAPANALGWPGRKKPNTVKVGKVMVARSLYDDARTAAEVGDLLAQRFGFDVTGFDSPGVDLETAREIARAVTDMLRKYEYVDLRGVHISQDATAGNAYAWTVPNKDPSGDWYSEIHFNLDYATNPKKLAASSKNDVATGFHVPNSHLRPAYSTVVHEFGHALDFNTKAKARKEIGPALLKYWEPRYGDPNEPLHVTFQRLRKWENQLSGYSFKKLDKAVIEPAEALAEAFADVEINGDKASEPGKVLHALLLKMSRRTP
ncbi:phage minor capsid protein [Nocardia sp. NPDC058640]|uniref:phage minor capsid protein n=1 Tax=Nocardia sp. NPDC058640 TaxID=3346571 RepID=UPI00365FA2C1